MPMSDGNNSKIDENRVDRPLKNVVDNTGQDQVFNQTLNLCCMPALIRCVSMSLHADKISAPQADKSLANR